MPQSTLAGHSAQVSPSNLTLALLTGIGKTVEAILD